MGLEKRYLSLDVMRGLDIALMIVVNTPGDGSRTFAPLHHAQWHGFTITDLVFPTFLFVVGTAMSFSMPALMEKGTGIFLRKILKRTLIIFLLGFLMYWFPFGDLDASGQWVWRPLSETRIFGVLQRIASCYGTAALAIYFLKPRGLVIFSILALLGYWLILLAFGDLSLTGNAVLKVDQWLLGDAHLYMGNGVPFDPEGFLSTLPAIVNVLAGYWAGSWIIRKGSSFESVSILMLWGASLAFIALAWDLVFPFNKKLWTSSFVIYTSAIDLMVLAFLVYWIDIRQWKRWTYFFEVMGRNPIVIYLFSEVLAILMFWFSVDGQSVYRLTFQTLFGWLPDYFASLAFAIAFMLVCWLVGYAMDRRKIYIKV